MIRCLQTLIKPLQQVQNSAIRSSLSFVEQNTPNLSFSNSTGSPINRESSTKDPLCYQIIAATLPQYLDNLVQIYVQSWFLRSSSDYRTVRFLTFKLKQDGGRAFSFSAVQTLNSLPFALRHSLSLSAFKTGLKTHLFKQYFDQKLAHVFSP